MPGGDKISLWVRHDLELFERRRDQRYMFEGLILDARTGTMLAQIKNQSPTSPNSWHDSGTGAFAVHSYDNNTSQIKLIDAKTCEVSATIDLGHTDSDIGHVRWAGETRLASAWPYPDLKSGVSVICRAPTPRAKAPCGCWTSAWERSFLRPTPAVCLGPRSIRTAGMCGALVILCA